MEVDEHYISSYIHLGIVVVVVAHARFDNDLTEETTIKYPMMLALSFSQFHELRHSVELLATMIAKTIPKTQEGN